MKVPQSTRQYTPEEKQQLVKNLDIEVEHRVRQLEEWLAVALDNFRLHQEGLISRIPRLVRSVPMGDFADKYNGDVQACLRGLQSERVGGAEFEIDRDTRKRKWAAAQEEVEASGSGGQGQGHEGETRAAKNARMMTATPKKPVANVSRAFVVSRTPGALRTTTTRPPVPKASPAPQKSNKAYVPDRSTSPAKQPHPNATNQRARLPSTATFNPTMLPPKAPTYPTMRAPRRDESMLSVNGSPLTNPYTLGLGWFTGEDVEEEESLLQGKGKQKQTEKQPPKTLRRVHSSIIIRRDPSVSLASSSSSSQPQPQTNGTRVRANSQTQHAAPHPAAHVRAHSRTQLLSPSGAAPPPSHGAPAPLAAAPSSSALVSIPTRDGHLLEFDPLSTSPRSLDKLVGITDSAKKQAKEEMARLVKEAVRKWVIE
ncbi:hypothetical protein OG21DRAFT_1479034 [Imleria badia]|nr:hypothetical protein OG21DRAFT_1479034 [Imleria badia]